MKEKLREAICYWIEVNHVNSALMQLVEETDEIGEMYEPHLWRKGSQTGAETTMMDVHVLVDKAAQQSLLLNKSTDDLLVMILKECATHLPEVFGKSYEAPDGIDMEELAERLIYDVADTDLYDYDPAVQFDKFCKVVQGILEEQSAGRRA